MCEDEPCAGGDDAARLCVNARSTGRDMDRCGTEGGGCRCCPLANGNANHRLRARHHTAPSGGGRDCGAPASPRLRALRSSVRPGSLVDTLNPSPLLARPASRRYDESTTGVPLVIDATQCCGSARGPRSTRPPSAERPRHHLPITFLACSVHKWQTSVCHAPNGPFGACLSYAAASFSPPRRRRPPILQFRIDILSLSHHVHDAAGDLIGRLELKGAA